MNSWTDAGCAIILITSEMPELVALSDRIIVMHRGRIEARLEGDGITQENILHAAMGQEKEIA
jgi:ABC-type sugar transport system ATPase subunit